MERMGLTPDWIIQVCFSGMIPARSSLVADNRADIWGLPACTEAGGIGWLGVSRPPLALAALSALQVAGYSRCSIYHAQAQHSVCMQQLQDPCT